LSLHTVYPAVEFSSYSWEHGEMAKLNSGDYRNQGKSISYAENVGRTGLAFLGALISISHFEEAPEKKCSYPGSWIGHANEVYRLADQMESIMPDQAAELRYLAART